MGEDSSKNQVTDSDFSKCIWLLSAVCLWAFSETQSFAQVPSSVEPGVIEREMEVPATPKSTRKITITQPGTTLPPENAESVTFTLQSVSIEGSSVYGANELSKTYQRFIGQEISLATVFAIANDITKKYSEDGYALSIGFVPAQEITSGTVRIGVAEGFVSDLEIRGEKYPKKVIRGYADGIMASRPLRSADLEQFLLLANDLPGLSVKSTFDRTEGGSGATKLILDVEQDRFGGILAINDRGSKALGRERGAIHMDFNSLFGGGGKVSLDYFQAFERQEVNYVGVGFLKPVGIAGTVIGLQAGQSEASPGTELLEILEFLAEGKTGALYVNHPFVRTRSRNLTGHMELSVKNLSSTILGAPNSEDHMRVLRFGLDYDWLDSMSGINLVSFNVSRGLDVLGSTSDSSPLKSRADGTFEFTKITGRFYRLQDFGGAIDAALSIDGQYAFDTLLSSEGCGYGGSQYGRGFDGFQIAGDHCIKGSVEVRWHVQNLPPSLSGLQVYGFADAGKVWKEGPPLFGEYKEKEASSAGIGLRFGIGKRASVSVEYAHPFEEEVGLEGNKDGRIFTGLGVRF